MTSPDPFIRAMFGASAVQVALHGFIQDQGNDGEFQTVIVGLACRVPVGQPHPLRFGSTTTHQLFLGDAVFRPRGVWESDKFKGSGVKGMFCSSAFCDPGEWDRLIIRDGLPVPNPAATPAAAV